ncbi:MAG TPA: protein tyrosine phosphatase family protein [Usitatibacter sp.]|nr:protein tyrosine phosphatase family protein [Usitatibacter sp.]
MGGACALAADRPENFVQWREGLASSAQPTSGWLGDAKANRYDVLINLAPPQSHGSIANEGGVVASKGVMYVNIPVDFMRPTAEDFRFFSEVMKASQGRSVFVHCQANFRASSFVFLYRVIHEEAPVGETWKKLQGVWVPEPQWKRFIEETLKASGKAAELL